MLSVHFLGGEGSSPSHGEEVPSILNLGTHSPEKVSWKLGLGSDCEAGSFRMKEQVKRLVTSSSKLVGYSENNPLFR